MSWAASLPGADFCFSKTCFLNKPLVPGSFAAWGRTFLRNRISVFEQATCPGQLRCLGQNVFSKNEFSGILGLLCAEQNAGNLKKYTFRNSGTPVRRTERRKSHKNELSGIVELLCAEQAVKKSQTMHFQELWDSCAQNKTSEISKNDFQ